MSQREPAIHDHEVIDKLSEITVMLGDIRESAVKLAAINKMPETGEAWYIGYETDRVLDIVGDLRKRFYSDAVDRDRDEINADVAKVAAKIIAEAKR